MWIFNRQPPPPIYKRKPLATATLVFAIVATLVLGPVGYLWDGMTEELKKKADYNTVVILMKARDEKAAKEEEIRKERESRQKEKDDRQWKAIEQMIQAPKTFKIKEEPVAKAKVVTEKKYITKETLNFYEKLSDKDKIEFRKLHPAYQALPPPE